MRIWVVKYGEVVPFGQDRKVGQLFRAGSLAQALAKRGHDVIWWTGRFEHQTKTFVAPKSQTTLYDPESPLEVRLIPSPGYLHNVSPARALDHWLFNSRLRKAMQAEQKRPDLIVVSFPIPDIAETCVAYGRIWSVPVVVDVRDRWPDILLIGSRIALASVPRR